MSVIRNTASALQKGRVGNTTYYVSGGQQIARQARNNSNYGDTATRSVAQQTRRVKWSNLVNFYKVCKPWMPKAFESKSRNQSDYNRFMQVNLNSSDIALTKDQALNNCCVITKAIISQGSLTPIETEPSSALETLMTDISLEGVTLSSATVGQISSAIIAQNENYKDGDNIACVLFKTVLDSRGYPYSYSKYTELTLDTSSTMAYTAHSAYGIIGTHDNMLCVNESVIGLDKYNAAAFIHTRKVDGNLLTSTQYCYVLWLDYMEQFSSDEQLATAIASYGVDEDVPLDPSFTKGSINEVLLNNVVNPSIKGSTVAVSGGQIVSVSGAGLSSSVVTLQGPDGAVTPFYESDSIMHFIANDNGTFTIRINGNVYGKLSVSGITESLPFTSSYKVGLFTNGTATSDPDNPLCFDDFGGLYNLTPPAVNYPYCILLTLSEQLSNPEDLWTSVGLTAPSGGGTWMIASNAAKKLLIYTSSSQFPATALYNGKIIAVFMAP